MEHKRRGTPFETAWVSALRTLPKGVGPSAKEQLSEWKLVLVWAKLEFRSAYLDQAETVPAAALRELAIVFSEDDYLATA